MGRVTASRKRSQRGNSTRGSGSTTRKTPLASDPAVESPEVAEINALRGNGKNRSLPLSTTGITVGQSLPYLANHTRPSYRSEHGTSLGADSTDPDFQDSTKAQYGDTYNEAATEGTCEERSSPDHRSENRRNSYDANWNTLSLLWEKPGGYDIRDAETLTQYTDERTQIGEFELTGDRRNRATQSRAGRESPLSDWVGTSHRHEKLWR